MRILPLFAGPDERPQEDFLVEHTKMVAALERLFRHWVETGCKVPIRPLDLDLQIALRNMVGLQVPHLRRINSRRGLPAAPGSRASTAAVVGMAAAAPIAGARKRASRSPDVGSGERGRANERPGTPPDADSIRWRAGVGARPGAKRRSPPRSARARSRQLQRSTRPPHAWATGVLRAMVRSAKGVVDLGRLSLGARRHWRSHAARQAYGSGDLSRGRALGTARAFFARDPNPRHRGPPKHQRHRSSQPRCRLLWFFGARLSGAALGSFRGS
jgi:hypothetical protein